jgi:hypothetical protein
VRFGEGCRDGVEVGEFMVSLPPEGEYCGGVEVADGGGEAVFKALVK